MININERIEYLKEELAELPNTENYNREYIERIESELQWLEQLKEYLENYKIIKEQGIYFIPINELLGESKESND